jgi:HEAT repeat protein
VSLLQSLFSRGEAVAFVALMVVILVVLASLAAAGLIAHHAWSSARRALWKRRLEIATRVVGDALLEPNELESAIARATRVTGPRVTGAALRGLRTRVGGELGVRLSELLEETGETARLARLRRSRRLWVRRRAARGLGECGGPAAVAALLPLLDDEVPDVRRTARMALLISGDGSAIEAAVTSYLEDAPTARGWKAAFYARVASVGPDHLRRLVESGVLPPAEEKLALESLGAAHDHDAVPLVRARLAAAEPEMRAPAVRSRGRVGDPAPRATVADLLADPVWYVRAVAARALESMWPDEESAAGLSRALSDDSWWVRANAARSLVQQGRLGLELLLPALSGSDAYARDAVLVALASPEGMDLLSAEADALAAGHEGDAGLAELLSRAQASHA